MKRFHIEHRKRRLSATGSQSDTDNLGATEIYPRSSQPEHLEGSPSRRTVERRYARFPAGAASITLWGTIRKTMTNSFVKQMRYEIVGNGNWISATRIAE
jgi:hypothetical protein